MSCTNQVSYLVALQDAKKPPIVAKPEPTADIIDSADPYTPVVLAKRHNR